MNTKGLDMSMFQCPVCGQGIVEVWYKREHRQYLEQLDKDVAWVPKPYDHGFRFLRIECELGCEVESKNKFGITEILNKMIKKNPG